MRQSSYSEQKKHRILVVYMLTFDLIDYQTIASIFFVFLDLSLITSSSFFCSFYRCCPRGRSVWAAPSRSSFGRRRRTVSCSTTVAGARKRYVSQLKWRMRWLLLKSLCKVHGSRLTVSISTWMVVYSRPYIVWKIYVVYTRRTYGV